jgi:hypothetical protein
MGNQDQLERHMGPCSRDRGRRAAQPNLIGWTIPRQGPSFALSARSGKCLL